MPRIRPLRKQEDVDKVPLEEAVTLEIRSDVSASDEKDELAVKPEEKKEPEKNLKTSEPDDRAEEFDALKAQLEDMKKAAEESRKAAQEADKKRREEAKRRVDRERELSHASTRITSAELETILTAMAAAESEAESAARDYETATANADFKLAAEANKRMAIAGGRLAQLEAGKRELEADLLRAKERSKREPEPDTPGSVEEHIDGMPGLLPSQRAWLKEHPDALTDQRKNTRLAAAHFEAEDQGLQPGTQDYFKFLDERLGYRKAEPKVRKEEEDEGVADEQDRAPLVSAPVSRETISPASGKPSSSRITLTPAQREAARMSGIDEFTYAQNLVKFNKMKGDGHYTN